MNGIETDWLCLSGSYGSAKCSSLGLPLASKLLFCLNLSFRFLLVTPFVMDAGIVF